MSLIWMVVGVAHADSLTSGVFVRADTDHTVVVSPRAHVAKRLNPATQLDVSYAADIWTSASIDVRASATLPVTEQRDELDLALTRELGDVALAGAYRYSVENDYVSHGLTLNAELALAQKSTTLSATGYAFADTVGRSGQPNFARALTTLGGRATLTQLIDPHSFAQLTYELGHLDGYQSSPYRFVGFGGTGLGCKGASVCLPEHLPGVRTRHAVALSARRAFGETLAAGATYRLYLDSWALQSHTLSAEVSFSPSEHTRFVLGYRFYIQSGVSFYAPVYTTFRAGLDYTTRDREQSPMRDQRVGLEWIQIMPLDESTTLLRLHTSVGGVAYNYANFVGLTSVQALELTLALSLEH
jgi:hypothetical protein